MTAAARLFLGVGIASWALGAAAGTALVAGGRADDLLADWPAASRQVARGMSAEYGPPDVVSPSVATWYRKGPWKWTLVYRDLGAPAGVLQQFVGYEVPAGKRAFLAAFGHGLVYDPTDKELSARSDGEETNILALNLADAIVRGEDVESARRFYDRTRDLSLSGKTSRWMRRLLFQRKEARPASSMDERRL